MKKLFPLLFLGLLLTLLVGVWTARNAMQVAVGYGAKQVCSGVFLSGLSEDFIQERDVSPNMAVLGPLLAALKINTDKEEGVVSASLLGVGARAVHLPGRGCILNGSGEGIPPLAPASADLESPGVPSRWRAAVNAAFAEPEPAAGARNTYALLVASRGELLLEAYASPITAQTRLQGWSMNKSLISTWIAMQAEQGFIDPTQPLTVLLEDDPEVSEIDPRLTLLHLLQMESGLDFVEVYSPGSDVTRMLYSSAAMWQVPAGKAQAYAPGEHFSYSSGDTVFASYLWQRTLGEPYETWIAREFAAPLGMDSLVAEADASGVQVGSSYAYLTARDWLKAGQLWLDAWHGRSELLSQDWLRDSVAPRSSDARGRYGRGFWLNTDGVAFEGLPETLFYAGGHAGQFVVVIPEWETVVVRLGLTGASVDKGMHEFLLSLAKLRSPAA